MNWKQYPGVWFFLLTVHVGAIAIFYGDVASGPGDCCTLISQRWLAPGSIDPARRCLLTAPPSTVPVAACAFTTSASHYCYCFTKIYFVDDTVPQDGGALSALATCAVGTLLTCRGGGGNAYTLILHQPFMYPALCLSKGFVNYILKHQPYSADQRHDHA